MGSLNKEIVDVIELHNYMEMKDLVSMTVKVEKQQNQRRAAKTFSNSNSKWSSKWPQDEDTKKNKCSDPKEKV